MGELFPNTKESGVSGPDNDRTIFLTSFSGPEILGPHNDWSLSSPRWSLSGPEISGPENDQIVWSLSGPGRCLVLLHRNSLHPHPKKWSEYFFQIESDIVSDRFYLFLFVCVQIQASHGERLSSWILQTSDLSCDLLFCLQFGTSCCFFVAESSGSCVFSQQVHSSVWWWQSKLCDTSNTPNRLEFEWRSCDRCRFQQWPSVTWTCTESLHSETTHFFQIWWKTDTQAFHQLSMCLIPKSSKRHPTSIWLNLLSKLLTLYVGHLISADGWVKQFAVMRFSVRPWRKWGNALRSTLSSTSLKRAKLWVHSEQELLVVCTWDWT